MSTSTLRTIKNSIRWVILLVCIGVALLYLNGGLASAWVAGGPPHDYPEAWLQHSYKQLSYSVAALCTGCLLFIALGQSFTRSKAKFLWALLLVCSLTYPHYREFMLSDTCLDSDGSWDAATFKCSR